ncbi:MAG: hypothetical protein WD042_07865 [Phycisphaeraceae bacterium]
MTSVPIPLAALPPMTGMDVFLLVFSVVFFIIGLAGVIVFCLWLQRGREREKRDAERRGRQDRAGATDEDR